MEPLSTTASIIFIIQISSVVVRYISTAAGATKERMRLRNEILGCETIHQQFKDEAKTPGDNGRWSETIKAIEASDGPLARLGAALNAIKIRLKPWNGLQKVLEKSSNENLTHLLNFEVTLTSIQDSHADIQRGLVGLKQHQDHHERRAILTWLTPIDNALLHHDFISRRQAGTRQWLLSSTEFQAWLNTSMRVMLCTGIPGAGKTIMTAIVVDYLAANYGNDSSHGIAYLYCNYRQQHEQGVEHLLMNVLRQLVEDSPSIPDIVQALYDRYKDRRVRPSLDEISKTLHSVAQAYSRVFLIIDALDECQASDGCRAKLLDEISVLQAKTKVNLLATSRPIPEIVQRFRGAVSLEIRAVDEDLPAFVRRQPDLQDEVKTNIIRSVDGMFLLAQLYLDSLISKRSPRAIRTALQELPNGHEAYDSLYNAAMDRIHGQNLDSRALATEVLSWVTCAKRPLTTVELRHALAIEWSSPELDEENISDIEDILAAETHIAKTCLGYLLFDTFSTGYCTTDKSFEERLRENVLYDYAARYWGHHARVASPEVGELVLAFLTSEAQISSSSQALMALAFGSYSGYSQGVPRKITGVCLSANFELREEMISLINRGHNPNYRDSYGRTPVLLAAENGHESVVEFLLHVSGVDPHYADKDGWSPLSHAVANGHTAVVELLLAEGVNPDSRDSNNWTPLMWAAENGNEAVVKLLEAK
ncbi:hypothetical protein BDV12DRAFT_210868 [Aspergillus spectabilis]